MDRAKAAAYSVEVLAAASALAFARLRHAHRAIAGLLLLGLACDLALEVDALPFGVQVALGTVYPWAVLAVVCGLLNRCPQGYGWTDAAKVSGAPRDRQPVRGIVALPWAAFVTTILVTGIRGPALAAAYAVAQVGLAIALALLVARWSRRSGDRRPTTTEACAVICAAAEIANAAGPYLDLPKTWELGRVTYCCCFLALFIVQGGGLWTLFRGSSGAGRSV